eukprot:6389639-Amphidinium_carterae.1
MEEYPCASNSVPILDRDVIDHYGRQLIKDTIDMKFYYLAEGRQVGSMTVHDFWFERRYFVDEKDSMKRVKDVNVMVTTYTAKRQGDPYNGAGAAEQPTGDTV